MATSKARNGRRAGFVDAYRTYAEGGWVGVGGDPQFGGMGMPKAVSAQVEEMINSSGLSFGLYPMLTAGACVSINAHADPAAFGVGAIGIDETCGGGHRTVVPVTPLDRKSVV